ncbi:hypothetical protein RchiOBHm_Chr1g0372231 [Rosa chinensis]|uniref:DUF7804 domain-containing protein n=1 Tax=Rosa chinensis TaxID=74649 RepID=A0A2P6SLT9_ROSCH|nr:uncharacterized protein LOC112194441 [Rosa chinensis]PRQ59623.1 hypothetical protein RchiOBHm_Chr1g0372231 [Rosa chinensis]
MASSLGIHCGGTRYVGRQDQNNLCSSSDYARRCSCSVAMPAPRNRGRGTIVNSSSVAVAETKRSVGRERSGSEKVDEWMRDSVTEIVKNLREAPLLVHVYDGKEKRRMETEKKVEEENWDALKGKWEAGEAPLPEGVIFVEELMDDGEVDGTEDSVIDGITRAWGLVVQGKGEESGPACYLLKTSRVNVGSGYGLGVGMGCTHFCLVRVKSFRETAQSQLKNSWLLQAQM